MNKRISEIEGYKEVRELHELYASVELLAKQVEACLSKIAYMSTTKYDQCREALDKLNQEENHE